MGDHRGINPDPNPLIINDFNGKTGRVWTVEPGSGYSPVEKSIIRPFKIGDLSSGPK